MIPPRLSVFEIPCIVDSICENLDYKDIRHCYQVNRTWRELFELHRYRDVWFTDLNSSQTQDIVNNAPRIRKLTVDLENATRLINAPCTRLKELYCVNMRCMSRLAMFGIHQFSMLEPFPVSMLESSPFSTQRSHFSMLNRPIWECLADNVLSLIGRNPELRKLDVCYHNHGVQWIPFTDNILTSLLSHQSLRFIRLKNLCLDAITFEALITHLPIVLQTLDLDIDIEEQHPSIHSIAFDINTNITTPMQLQRLDLHGSLVNHEVLLLPLLRRSPLLEHIKSCGMARGEGIIRALIEHCPNLQSFHDHDSQDSITMSIGTVCTLLEAYPTGMRSLTLRYIDHFIHSTSLNQGALTRSLLKYSAYTIDVLVLVGNMGYYIDDIASVLEQCPNLRVLRVARNNISLDDLVHESSWKAATSEVLEPTISGSKEPLPCSPPHSLALLPWVCTKLEELSLNIGKPGCRYGFPRQQYQRQAEINARNELAIPIVRQVGLLWNALNSLKSLKALSLIWESDLRMVIHTMPFECIVSHMSEIGLTGFTHEEAVWMGIDWQRWKAHTGARR
ncbi:hypothetical protein BGZ65_006515 [Modicella reniformis]|uniref:F-box domain-containing protein n=1 Tax=Modicella reniformis TaxID=1440133 RepID=A0A9P6SPQ6_9FUNG|nr:hypothetical protein BGZ65_006515 [Modicella reniformis]